MSVAKVKKAAGAVPGVRTVAVCRRLRVSYGTLMAAMLRGKIVPRPPKDGRGDYRWRPEDIERARQALALDLRHTRSGRRRVLA
jgi:hypothetical protein